MAEDWKPPEWADGDVYTSDLLVYVRANGVWVGTGVRTGNTFRGVTDEDATRNCGNGVGTVLRKQSEGVGA